MNSHFSQRVTEEIQRERLLQMARYGDKHATNQLFAAHRDAMLQYLRPRTRTLDDAEDVTQRIMHAAYVSLSRYKQAAPPLTWMIGIGRNLLKDYYARTGCRDSYETPLDDGYKALEKTGPYAGRGNMPAKTVQERMLAERLFRAIDEIECSSMERQVLKLRLMDLNTLEVARLLNISPADVGTHWRRGRGKLYAYLAQHHRDLLGGDEALDTAYRKACCDANSDHRLGPDEMYAWAHPKGNVKNYRNALIKVVRYLPLSLVIFGVVCGN
jgi:RNA polymerase sigma factor (sigma-70 family)